MSSSLEQQLQRALGGQYRIERELGGGGMSRVFVAEETGLGRMVVVKLLPPEMAAAVSAERFRREIQLAAGLQHPHVLPVLSAGAADGLLYYTMPFVDGLSLRDRLVRDGRLPLDDAVAIIGEVAGALGYAHARGLVHRDIKPENVLLSQGHALVTDFGIAKVLSGGGDAPASTATAGGLTGMGMSIGTPAYMSPEQGVGDPATDHRADIYSLGVMAYELLSGATPFADRQGTHQLLMAHMVEPPPPLGDRRPDAPPALVDLVMRCLAKQPQDRPATGEEIVRALRGLGGGAGDVTLPRAHAAAVAGGRGGLRPAWIAAAALLVATAAAGLYVARGRGAPEPVASASGAGEAAADRVTVTTFVNETNDAAMDPVGRMAADWITTALAGTGLVKVIDARAAMGAGGARMDAAAAVRTARELGAGTIVTGSYYRLGDSLQFDVKLLDARTAEVVQVLPQVRGPASDPTATIELLRQRTLGALATRFNPQLTEMAKGTSQPPSYEAYQQIVAGMDAFFTGDLAQARTRFEEASRLDTANVQSRTWLLEVLETTGALPTADSVARSLEARRARLSPLEQAQLDEYTSSIRKNPAANVAASFRLHRLAPSGQYRTTLARKLMVANRWQEALDTLVAAPAEVGIFKDKPTPLELRCALLHRLGRHEDELLAADELTRRFGAEPRFRFAQARALAALGRTDSLESIAGRIASTPGAGSWRNVLRALADELRAHGHAAASQSMLQGILASYDRMGGDSASVPAVLRGRAETLARMGRWPEATAIVKPAVMSDTALAARLSLAVAMAHAGDPSLAERVDRTVAAMPLDPYQPAGALLARARLAVARGDRASALALLKAAQDRALPLYDAVHASMEFEALRGDPALEALLRPGS